MSLVFYDTETTGIEKFFDQILQFAAIRTNEELEEVDTFAVRCRLLPHIVPAPDAMRVTGVTASQLTDAACPSHYEMVRRVEARLASWSPALFLGWNSIKFDEELLRQAFYKTLHNPYLTNTANNTRTDALRIVQACDLFAPEALVIPTDRQAAKSTNWIELLPRMDSRMTMPMMHWVMLEPRCFFAAWFTNGRNTSGRPLCGLARSPQ